MRQPLAAPFAIEFATPGRSDMNYVGWYTLSMKKINITG
jgi:hypothetical protein